MFKYVLEYLPRFLCTDANKMDTFGESPSDRTSCVGFSSTPIKGQGYDPESTAEKRPPYCKMATLRHPTPVSGS